MNWDMDRRHFLTRSVPGAAAMTMLPGLVGQSLAQAAGGGGERPNILFIVAEDMGPQIGCYGDDTVPTPNLDGLASRGVCFQNGYVTQASCSPSRSSILTGLYPHENFQLGLAHHGYRMHRGIPNLPSLLKGRGYRTGIQGKLHVNPANEYSFDWRGSGHSKDVRRYATAAEEFLQETGDQPWFLYVNYADCHKPYADQHKGIPEKPVQGKDVRAFPVHQGIDDPKVLDETAGYYNGVQRVDAGVGLLLDLLERKGLKDKTLVLFIGDHGPPVSRGKTTTYEFGVRIPFILSWPGVSGQGVRSSALVSTVDILPTLVTAAGGELPRPLSGAALQPLLQTGQAPWRETLLTEWHTHGPGFQPQRALRDEWFKLIINMRPEVKKMGLGVDGCAVRQALNDPKYKGTEVKRVFDMLESPPRIELYDLKNDPIEYNNLAGKEQYADVEKRLRQQLQAWLEKTRDPFLDADVFEAHKEHFEDYSRRLPEMRKKVKPDKRGRRRVPINMAPFQKSWDDIVTDRYEL